MVFVKPAGRDNEHSGYTDEVKGQQRVTDIVHAVQNSKIWNDTAIRVTYDENGGRWDHVASRHASLHFRDKTVAAVKRLWRPFLLTDKRTANVTQL